MNGRRAGGERPIAARRVAAPLDGDARWPIQRGTDVPHALPTVRAARDEAAQTVDANISQNSGEAHRSGWEGSTTESRGPGFGRAFVASGIGFCWMRVDRRVSDTSYRAQRPDLADKSNGTAPRSAVGRQDASDSRPRCDASTPHASLGAGDSFPGNPELGTGSVRVLAVRGASQPVSFLARRVPAVGASSRLGVQKVAAWSNCDERDPEYQHESQNDGGRRLKLKLGAPRAPSQAPEP
jgi:hypothetical protein